MKLGWSLAHCATVSFTAANRLAAARPNALRALGSLVSPHRLGMGLRSSASMVPALRRPFQIRASPS